MQAVNVIGRYSHVFISRSLQLISELQFRTAEWHIKRNKIKTEHSRRSFRGMLVFALGSAKDAVVIASTPLTIRLSKNYVSLKCTFESYVI